MHRVIAIKQPEGTACSLRQGHLRQVNEVVTVTSNRKEPVDQEALDPVAIRQNEVHPDCVFTRIPGYRYDPANGQHVRARTALNIVKCRERIEYVIVQVVIACTAIQRVQPASIKRVVTVFS